MIVRLHAIVGVALAGLLTGCSGDGNDTGTPAGTATGTSSGTASGTTTTDIDFDASTPDGGDGGEICQPVDYPLSETQVDLPVPVNAHFMQVKAWGAGGNGEGQCTFPDDDAGLGGFSGANFRVCDDGCEITPGSHLVVIVGQRGRAGLPPEDDVVRFGFGVWGGGGLSGIFHGPDLITETDRDKAIIIAGGGGGATAPGCDPAGTGNHPTAAGGHPNTMIGGQGDENINGGGGGYEGGAGGSNGPGKGGTGFIHSAAEAGSVMVYSEPGSRLAPRWDDPDYYFDPATDAGAGTDEQAGRLVVHFTCDTPPPI